MKQRTYTILLLALMGLVACTPPDQSSVVTLSTAQPAQDTRPLTLVATVTSPASTPIAKVEFFRGETLLGQDTSSPYEFTLPINVSANTTLEFSAKATDAQNRTGKKNLSVPVAADTQAPTAQLQGSASSFTTGGTLSLSASASDNIGGQLHCWGGYPNVGAAVPQASLVAQGAIPTGVSVSRLSVGYTACILGSNGWAYCWGLNVGGSVGDGTISDRANPVAVSQGAIPVGVTLTRMDTNSFHTCAIGSNGQAYCWGTNGDSKLGRISPDTSAPGRVLSPAP